MDVEMKIKRESENGKGGVRLGAGIKSESVKKLGF